MKLLQILQSCLEDWARITSLSFLLTDLQGNVCCSTDEASLPETEVLEAFVRSSLLCQSDTEYCLHKISDDREVRFLLVIRGKHAYLPTLGELAVCQVESLVKAYTVKTDKNRFFQGALLGEYSEAELLNRGRQLKINPASDRMIFLVQTKQPKDENALATIRNIFSAHTKDVIAVLEGSGIVIIHEMLTTETDEDMLVMAHMLVDMLGTEAMTSAWVSFGTRAESLTELARAWHETCTAMEVGKIFRTQDTVFSYRRLGLGRLIYQLPEEICEMFVEEVFGGENPRDLDDETLSTIRTLFENNLNMSETARQLYVHRNTLVYRFEKLQKKYGLDVRTFEDALTFKIAMMVVDYLRVRKGRS